ncbi:hypothetical protein OF83DRAFT_1066832 [Amylostereum chailletii]|nr:hypothetical protein OF83DRAFT_1066832 [Amylostereum chailletii]
MSKSYALTDLAYTKMVAHALKHPHARVNGVLLGSAKGKEVEIVDTIPLLHHWTSLSPMMEIGLEMAKGHAEGRGLAVVGYYTASEYIEADSATLGHVGERIVERLRNDFADALAVVIDGENLGKQGQAALIPYTSTSPTSSFHTAPTSLLKLSNTIPDRALDLARTAEILPNFGDFDDHLEDVTIDWLRNTQIEAALGHTST